MTVINNYKKASFLNLLSSHVNFFSFILNSLLVDTQVHQLNYSYNAISYYDIQNGCLS